MEENEFRIDIEQYLKDYCRASIDIATTTRYLEIDFRQLAITNPSIAEALLDEFEKYNSIVEAIVNDICDINQEEKWISVHFQNIGKSNEKEIWALRASDLDKVVSIVGKITQIGEMYTRVFFAHYECPQCGNLIEVRTDISDLDHRPKEPSRCSCGRKGRFKSIHRLHKDFMKIILTEDSKNSDQKSIMVLLSGALCRTDMMRTVSLNRKVNVVGVVKQKLKSTKENDAQIKYIFANSVSIVDEELTDFEPTQEDIPKFIQLSKSPTLFQDLAQSVHPNISGYPNEKLATLFQLVGGSALIRNNRIEERGVIHILLSGSPGTAKSQMLKNSIKFLMNANQAEGRATSGAGLVCAAVKDEELGYSCSAGKVALANGAITAIDEMDKIDKDNLAYLNTAMVNMFVNFDKGGLHLILQTNTAILGACNPKNKVFDNYSKKRGQIGIEADLLDRFDLIFPMETPRDEESKRKILNLILNKYEEKPDLSEPVYSFRTVARYITYARRIEPKLSEQTRKYIIAKYLHLVTPDQIDDASYFSMRLVTNIVRLAQASAKIRLSKIVEQEDADRAFGLLVSSLQAQDALTMNGSINYEKVEGILGKNKRDKMHLILNSIKTIINERAEKLAPFEEIYSLCKQSGIEEIEFEELFEKLKKEGEIIETKRNRYSILR